MPPILPKSFSKPVKDVAYQERKLKERTRKSNKYEELLDDELEDMNAYLEDRKCTSWSRPQTHSPSRGGDATSVVREREFDMMDPLDYLNARDLAEGGKVKAADSKPSSSQQSLTEYTSH